jgi:hypothetical protein
LARVQKKMDWMLLAATAFLGPGIGAGMALLSRGYIEERQLADKPYVEKRFEAGMKYTDDKSEQVRRDSFEHSDTNRRDLTLKMEQMNTEYQTSNAKLSGKIDTLIEKVEGLKDELGPRKRPRGY